MAAIHPTSIVAPGARLGEGTEIGPYSIIGPDVEIGARTRILSHGFVDGHTRIGEDCAIYPFASLGLQTQDLKFKGGAPRVEIGDRNTIREYVTINAATGDGEITRVGSGCHIMAYTHIAHNCTVGDGVIMANCATLAGHVTVGDGAIIEGMVGIHQFVRLGCMCFIGGMSKVTQDVPPYMLADGIPLEVHSINSVGLKRRGMPEETLRALKNAYKIVYRQNLPVRLALEKIEADLAPLTEIRTLVEFIRGSERGIAR